MAQDFPEAVRWFRLSADQGDAHGQFNLGDCYRLGHGVAQNYVEAARWFRLAAEQGDPDAQYYLGTLYDAGQGVPQDAMTAYMWLNLAASGYTGEDRERAVSLRDTIAQRLTREDLSEAQRRSREWTAAHPTVTSPRYLFSPEFRGWESTRAKCEEHVSRYVDEAEGRRQAPSARLGG